MRSARACAARRGRARPRAPGAARAAERRASAAMAEQRERPRRCSRTGEGRGAPPRRATPPATMSTAPNALSNERLGREGPGEGRPRRASQLALGQRRSHRVAAARREHAAQPGAADVPRAHAPARDLGPRRREHAAPRDAPRDLAAHVQDDGKHQPPDLGAGGSEHSATIARPRSARCHGVDRGGQRADPGLDRRLGDPAVAEDPGRAVAAGRVRGEAVEADAALLRGRDERRLVERRRAGRRGGAAPRPRRAGAARQGAVERVDERVAPAPVDGRELRTWRSSSPRSSMTRGRAA